MMSPMKAMQQCSSNKGEIHANYLICIYLIYIFKTNMSKFATFTYINMYNNIYMYIYTRHLDLLETQVCLGLGDEPAVHMTAWQSTLLSALA